MAGPMPPPPLPAARKRNAADVGLDDDAGAPAGSMAPPKKPPRRAQLGEDLPDEVSKEDIERMLNEADDVHIETLNEVVLKRMALGLERKIKNNQDLRIKHVDEPDKFMKSEVDLDEEVKKFSLLAAHPELYAELVKLGAIPALVGLLNHVNTDIAVDVFEVLSELTDTDAIADVEEPEAFVTALFEAQLCEMTVDTLLRIDETQSEEDAKAVTNCLTMIENLTEVNPVETCDRFSKVPRLLPWLIKRCRQQAMDYNRVYSAEILGIFLQNSADCRDAMGKLDGVDKLLRGIAMYRKRDPEDSEESEFAQNMFDCLCSLMLLPQHQIKFGEVQGLELMVRMMRERKFAGALALRLADHAMRHCPANCQIFVDKLGLKVLFAMFMKKGPKAKAHSAAREAEEHVVTIIQSLCRYCTGTAVARVLNKFTENRFEKLERLLELHEEYARSVKESDEKRLKGDMQKLDRELEVDEEEQLFLDRCDAGLFTLQQVDLILVRLANMGNRQISEEMSKLMDIKGVPQEQVLGTIAEYRAHVDESAVEERRQVREFAGVFAKRAGVPDPFAGEAGGDSDEDERRIKPSKTAKRPDAAKDDVGGATTPPSPAAGSEDEKDSKKTAVKEKVKADRKDKEKKDKKRDK
eukprot:TRINITY_DN90629_c0_g1_i1.p1 TRINITY_DN90629_c0_g1~~TRINITY_DN90629_c0_g1_i1.p1  ORF type:complete len:667 (-),score=192.20 TRINITY_DN90629_c0_g1_i1:42-1952(-)